MNSNRRCGILDCNEKATSMYRPPNPKHSWDLFVAWWKASGNTKYLGMSPNQIHKKMSFCERHFAAEEILQLKHRVKTCIPSLHLPAPLVIPHSIGYIDLDQPLFATDENNPLPKERTSVDDSLEDSKRRKVLMELDVYSLRRTRAQDEDETMIRNGNLDLGMIQMPQEIPSLIQNVNLPFVDCDSSQCSNPSPHGVGALVVRRRQLPVMTVPSTSTSMPKGIPGDLHPYKYKPHQNADLFQDCQKLLDKFNYPWELMPLMYTILKDAKWDLDEASRKIDEGKRAVNEYSRINNLNMYDGV